MTSCVRRVLLHELCRTWPGSLLGWRRGRGWPETGDPRRRMARRAPAWSKLKRDLGDKHLTWSKEEMCLTLSLAAVSDKEERAIAVSPKSCPSTKLSSRSSSRLLPVRSNESREEDQRTAYTKVFKTERAPYHQPASGRRPARRARWSWRERDS